MASERRKCPVCGEYDYFGAKFLEHRCKPAFECRAEWQDGDDDWQIVRAVDAESAAAQFAERYDCEGGDYSIVSRKMSDAVVIQVRKPDEKTFERWSIEAESVPTYYATKINPSPEPQP